MSAAELSPVDFRALGHAAYLNDGHRAPALVPEIRAALDGNPVGHPDNLRIPGEYLAGWDAAAEEAAAAVLAEDAVHVPELGLNCPGCARDGGPLTDEHADGPGSGF